MSSDLWAPYAGRFEDLSNNPWTTPTSDVPLRPVGSTAQSTSSHATSLAASKRASEPEEHMQWGSSQKTRDEPETGFGSWADLQALQQDVWGDVQSSRSSVPERSTHAPTEPNCLYLAPKSPQQLSIRVQEEDEFGEFEEPILQPSLVETKPTAPHLSKPIRRNSPEVALNKTLTTTARRTDAHHQIPEPVQEYDPWGGLESFGKVKIEESVPEIQSLRSASKRHEKLATQNATVETPAAEVLWDADDWEAFSEDPNGSSMYGYNDETTADTNTKLQTTTRATTTSHAPSYPPTKDRTAPRDKKTTHSKPSSVLPPSNKPPPSWDTDEWEPFSPPPNSTPAPSTKDPQTTFPIPQNLPLPLPRTLTPSRPPSTPQSRSESSAKPAKSSPLPPTNVPPPSILLSLLSSLILQLPTQVRAVSSQPHPPASLAKALHNCLASLRVAARILAGRRLRWKRDTHLSQSMAIGPSHAGKSGGMKLTGVDKTEAQREDREAVEFVRGWKAGLGGIRAALAEVSGRVEGARLMLPEIGEGMGGRLKVLQGEGGGGGRCCFLCGLRRGERVGGVDGEVEDGWGEWWVEFWGHVECKAFWVEHERFLQRRG